MNIKDRINLSIIFKGCRKTRKVYRNKSLYITMNHIGQYLNFLNNGCKLLYKNIIFFLLLTVVNSVWGTNSSNKVSYKPMELIGKEFVFCFSQVDKDINVQCFYHNIDTVKIKAYSKDIFLRGSNGQTPLGEIYNHSFKALDILFKDSTDYSKGFFLLLSRDDGEKLWMKFDKFNRTKNQKKKSFSDIFYVKKRFNNEWETIVSTDILIPVYDITKIKNDLTYLEDPSECAKLNIFRDSIPTYSHGRINKDSSGVTITLSQDSCYLQLTPSALSSLADAKHNKIRKFIIKEKCIQKYDSLKIDKLKKLVGKNVWASVSLGLHEPPHYYDDDTQDWLNKSYGSAIKEVQSVNFMSMRGIKRINCDVVDLLLLPNCLRENERQRFYWDMTPVYNKDSPRFNEYCYYIVIKPNRDMEYWPYGATSFNYDNKAYIMVNDIEEADFFTNEELEACLIEFYKAEKADIDAFNNSQQVRFEIANAMWGNDIANIISKGEVRFGFSQEMCKMAYYTESFNEGTASLPVGSAVVLDFSNKQTKLYFINNKLIGIQFKMGEIKYR